MANMAALTTGTAGQVVQAVGMDDQVVRADQIVPTGLTVPTGLIGRIGLNGEVAVKTEAGAVTETAEAGAVIGTTAHRV